MTSALSTVDTAPLRSQMQNWYVDARETWQQATGNTSKSSARVQAANSDEEMMAAICEGSEAALEELYERYHRQAFSLAYHMLHDAATAEDILQEAFLALWRKAPSYQARHGRVPTWLLAIVHHRALDKIRSSAHRDKQCTSLQNDPEQAEDDIPRLWFRYDIITFFLTNDIGMRNKSIAVSYAVAPVVFCCCVRIYHMFVLVAPATIPLHALRNSFILAEFRRISSRV